MRLCVNATCQGKQVYILMYSTLIVAAVETGILVTEGIMSTKKRENPHTSARKQRKLNLFGVNQKVWIWLVNSESNHLIIDCIWMCANLCNQMISVSFASSLKKIFLSNEQ